MTNFVNNAVNFSKYAIIYLTKSKREEATDQSVLPLTKVRNFRNCADVFSCPRLGCCHLFGSFRRLVRSTVAQQENPSKSELKLRGFPIKSTRKIGRPDESTRFQRRIQIDGRRFQTRNARSAGRLDHKLRRLIFQSVHNQNIGAWSFIQDKKTGAEWAISAPVIRKQVQNEPFRLPL